MFPREPLPSRIGPYRILRRLSSRRGADLYLGIHEGPMDFTRECVLKLVPSPGSAGDLRSAEELAQEARVCSRLAHPAIVRMHDFFEHGENLVLVFEHFAGVSLARLWSHMRRRKQQLGDEAIWYIAHGLFSALMHAHSLTDEADNPTPVIHRDVQPAHIVMSADAQVRLAGFGIAKISGAESNTAIGFVKGTPAYMAPEQARGEKVTERVDVFAAGLVVWEMLTGRSIVPGPEVGQGAELLALIGGRRIEPLSSVRRDLPREMVAAIDACLEFSPTKRQIRCADVVRWIDKLADLTLGRAELRERLVQVRNAALRSPPSSNLLRSSVAPPSSVAPRAPASRYPGIATRMTGRAGESPDGDAPPRTTRRVPPVMAPPSSSRPAPALEELTAADEEHAAQPNAPAPRTPVAPQRSDRSARPKGTLLGLAPGPVPMPPHRPPAHGEPSPSLPAMPPPPMIAAEAPSRGPVANLRPPPGVHVEPAPAATTTTRVPAPVMISHVSPGEAASSGDTTILTRRSGSSSGRPRTLLLVLGVVGALAATAIITVGIASFSGTRRAVSPMASEAVGPALSSARVGVSTKTPPKPPEPTPSAVVSPSAPVSAAPPVVTSPPVAETKPLPRGLGAVIVRSPPEGTVYISGVPLGETNEQLVLACGRQKFVRVGSRPGPRGLMGTTWLSPGQSVLVRCGEVVEVNAMPRYAVPDR